MRLPINTLRKGSPGDNATTHYSGTPTKVWREKDVGRPFGDETDAYGKQLNGNMINRLSL